MKKYFYLFLILIVCLPACAIFRPDPSPTAFAEIDKTASFATTDLAGVTKLFADALDQEGYKILSKDLNTGTITATVEKIDQLGSFNSGFSGGSNYKLVETLSVEVSSQARNEEIVSKLKITHNEKYSMGQEVSEDYREAALYRSLFARVKAGLALGR